MLPCDCPRGSYGSSPVAWFVTLGLVGALAVWYLAFMCLRCRRGAWCRLPKWSGLWAQRAMTQEEKKVLAIFVERRWMRYQKQMQAGLYFGLPLIIIVVALLCFSSQQQTGSIVKLYAETVLPEGLFLAFATLAFNSFESRMGVRVLDSVYIAIFLSLGVHTALVEDTNRYTNTCRGVEIAQLMMTVLVGNRNLMWIPIVLNLIFQAGVVLAMPALQLNAQEHLIDVFKSTVCFMIIASATHGWTMAEAEATMKLTKATRSQATTLSLLSMICDAVVHLRQDFTLREPCPRLSALLLRSPTLNDVPFKRYLSEMDVERFEQFAAESSKSLLGQARSLHVHLRDSLGSLVPVQIFMTSYQDLEDTTNHLIGVTEESNEGARAQRIPDVSDVSPQLPDVVFKSEEAGSERSSSMRSKRSDRTGPQVPVLSQWGSGQPFDETMLSVRMSLQVQVLSESQSCSTLFGFGVGTSSALEDFLQRFRNSDRVCHFLKDFYGMTLCRGGLGVTQSFGRVRIISAAAGSDYEADLVVSSSFLFDDSEDAPPLSAVFDLLLVPVAAESKTRAEEKNRKRQRRAFKQSAKMLARNASGSLPSEC